LPVRESQSIEDASNMPPIRTAELASESIVRIVQRRVSMSSRPAGVSHCASLPVASVQACPSVPVTASRPCPSQSARLIGPSSAFASARGSSQSCSRPKNEIGCDNVW